jgi:hypothetical protein
LISDNGFKNYGGTEEMSKKKRKVPIHLSLDEDDYEDYRASLRGTRFDSNGEVNASAAIRYHIQSVNEERKKSLALGQSVQDKSAIKQLSNNDSTNQVTLEKICPEWILDHTNTERRNKTLEGLESEDLRTLGISCKTTGTAIMSTLPELKLRYNDRDNLRKRLDLENIQTTTTPEEDYPEEEEEIVIE